MHNNRTYNTIMKMRRWNPAAALRCAVWILLSALMSGVVGAQTNIRNNGTITNTGTTTIAGYFENFKNAGGGTFNNSGTYNIGTYFSNNNTGGTDGTMTITAGTVTVTGNYTNDNGSTTVNGTGNLKLGGATNANATPILFSVSSGAVEYSGAAQNVLAATYNGLRLSGSGNKTMDGSVTVNTTFDLAAGTLVVGANTLDIKSATLTSIAGTLSAASGTVSYTLAGTQQVFPATYNILTLSGAFTKTAQGAVTINGTLNNPSGTTLAMGSNSFTTGASANVADGVNPGTITTAGTVTFGQASPDIGGTFNYTGTSQAVAIAQYKDLTLSGTTPSFGAGTFLVSGVLTNSTSPAFNASSIVDFNGSGSQTIPAMNYANLTSSSSGARTLAGSGTIGVSGTFTPGTNSYTITGSTMNFNNATGGQSVPSFNYYNLTTGNTSGVNTLIGSIGVSNTFTPSAGALTAAGTSTVNFNNATGGQSVAAFNYYNLTTSNSSGVTTLTGTVGVSNTFTPSAGALTSAGTSTVDYNASTTQTITLFTYNHLTLTSGSAVTKNLGGAVTVNGNLTVNANNSLNDAGYQITGNGTGTFSLAAGSTMTLGTAGTATLFPTSFTNGNTTLNATSTVVYNSDQAQTISAVPTYGNLTLTATSSVTKTISGTANISGNLTIGTNNTLSVAGGSNVTITLDMILNGDISNSGTIDVGL